ncbi:hypothetical protein KY285_029812 [Solanum tuberosum]|nr:hypothetical protein KY285_029812 [Solanum tuberosum]
MDVDVATEIMSGLPVRSLLRFKCVSKLWMTLISDPYFSKKHLNHARNDVQQIEHVQKLDFPCNDKPWRYSLYCCCNGMALMGFCNYPDKHFQLLLWNPSTRESIVLPYPKILPKDYCTWGLGYDSASDDYKILKIDDKSCSEILALKSGSWRLLDKHPIDVHPMLKSTGSLTTCTERYLSQNNSTQIACWDGAFQNWEECYVFILVQMSFLKFGTSKGPFGLWPQSDVVQNGFVYTENENEDVKTTFPQVDLDMLDEEDHEVLDTP